MVEWESLLDMLLDREQVWVRMWHLILPTLLVLSSSMALFKTPTRFALLTALNDDKLNASDKLYKEFETSKFGSQGRLCCVFVLGLSNGLLS